MVEKRYAISTFILIIVIDHTVIIQIKYVTQANQYTTSVVKFNF